MRERAEVHYHLGDVEVAVRVHAARQCQPRELQVGRTLTAVGLQANHHRADLACAERTAGPDAVWRGAVYSENLGVVADATRLLLGPTRGPEAQINGRLTLAEFEWARGRPRAAAAVLSDDQGQAEM